jgi:hypothetical protein
LALVGRVAQALNSEESHIGKDWHVVRALAVIASVSVEGVQPVLSGGTSLAKGWDLIKRFSEDIDFKVGVEAPNPSAARTRRRTYRARVLQALEGAGFAGEGEPLVGNQSRFFRVSFDYGASFPATAGMRPAIKVEMTFEAPALAGIERPVQSLVAQAQRQDPETRILCVDPIETAADKLGALAWRTRVRDRRSPGDDPTIVRHIHDLAAPIQRVGSDPTLPVLSRRIVENDSKRAKDAALDGRMLLGQMLPAITSDPQWRKEYEQFVQRFAWGPDDGRIGFDQAISACRELVARVLA